MHDTALIIMAKEPKVGYNKTRLTPPLSPADATRLYEALLRDTISLVSSIDGLDLAIAVTPPESTNYFKLICPTETLFLPVECKDIGDCLSKVLETLLKRGYSKVFALNADSPHLPPEYIEEAIHLLALNDIVLGPSLDGGYYLVGLKRLHEEIFADIHWSTATVLSETLEIADKSGLKAGILQPWYDIDSFEEIRQLQGYLKGLPKDVLIHTRQVLDSVALDTLGLD